MIHEKEHLKFVEMLKNKTISEKLAIIHDHYAHCICKTVLTVTEKIEKIREKHPSFFCKKCNNLLEGDNPLTQSEVVFAVGFCDCKKAKSNHTTKAVEVKPKPKKEVKTKPLNLFEP